MKNLLRVMHFIYRNTIRSGRYSPKAFYYYLRLGSQVVTWR